MCVSCSVCVCVCVCVSVAGSGPVKRGNTKKRNQRERRGNQWPSSLLLLSPLVARPGQWRSRPGAHLPPRPPPPPFRLVLSVFLCISFTSVFRFFFLVVFLFLSCIFTLFFLADPLHVSFVFLPSFLFRSLLRRSSSEMFESYWAEQKR